MAVGDDALGRKFLKQNAALFARAGNNPDGTPIWNNAVAVKCRWDEKTILYIKANGEETASTAVVMMDRDFALGDMLRLAPDAGRGDPITSLTSATDPLLNDNVFEIQGRTKIGNKGVTKFYRAAIL